jgi:WD40 repeat protein
MDAPAVPEGAPAAAARQLSYRLARTLTGHEGSVASVKFSPDGQWCARCCALLSVRSPARAHSPC